MMLYVESYQSFVADQRKTASEFRLTALGPAIGFYEKVGMSQMGSAVFSKTFLDKRTHIGPDFQRQP